MINSRTFEILSNLKIFLLCLLDNGKNKLVYNDQLHDEKTIDCINAINDIISEYEKQIKINDENYKKLEELKKYDYRNIKLDDKDKLKSPCQKMSEADKLFEELGYKKLEDKYNIDFNKIYNFTNGDKIQEKIRFCKLDKYIHVENYNFNIGITFGKYLDMQELKAINLKCKELDWIEE